MADKNQVVKEKVEHSGLFDFPSFYKFAHSLFADEGIDITETDYKEAVTGSTRNISFNWSGTRSASDYFKHEIKASFKVSDLVEVEVEIDGKKKKTNKGKVSVDLKGTLIRDPDNKWEDSMFNRFLRDTYNKYVIPGAIESQENKIIADIIKIKEEIKVYLDLSGKRS